MRFLIFILILSFVACAKPSLIPPTRVDERFIPGYEPILVVGSPGQEIGEFDHPTSISLDEKGNIYVTDTGNYRIQAFDSTGKVILCIGGPGEGFGALGGITLKDKKIFVVDRTRKTVLAFTKDGKPIPFDLEDQLQQFEDLTEIAIHGNRIYGVEGDRGITLRNSHLYVTDIDKVEKYGIGKEGELLKVLGFGGWGNGHGEFMLPQGIDVDTQGFIYVADTLNNRIQKFSPRGKFILSITHLDKPTDVAIGRYGELWVVENGAHRIKKFIPKIKVILPEDVLRHENYEWAYNCGRQYQLMKRYYHAIAYFNESIAIKPDSKLVPLSKLQIARCWRDLGNNEEALMAYDRIVEDYPRSKEAPLAMFEKGELLKTLSLFEDALRTYKELIRLYPDAKESRRAEKKVEEIEGRILGG